MGALVAHLHGLQIPLRPAAAADHAPGERWEVLAKAGARRSAPWVQLIEDSLGALDTTLRLAVEALGDEPLIGSHCDLNAHNVLFDADRLVLIDWDAAGPASARLERVSFAMLWSQTPAGEQDPAIATAFLRGYRDGGGHVGVDDPDVLPARLQGLTWWAQQNVAMALDGGGAEQDALAMGLVQAVLDGPKEVDEDQYFLTQCIRGL